jgi:hypothetical protein
VEVLGRFSDGSADFWRKASASYRGNLPSDIISEQFVRDTLQKSEDIIAEKNNTLENGVNSSPKDLGKVLLQWTTDNPANAITSEFHVVSSNEMDFDVVFGRKSIIQHNLPGRGLSNPKILKAVEWIHPIRERWKTAREENV